MVLALAASLPGCARLGLAFYRALPDRGRECPGPLVPTEEMGGGDFLLEQNARVQGEGLDWALTLVSQKRGSRLVVVGLDPFGAKLFTLTQQGSEVTVERPAGRLPLPPVNLLRDLQRAFRQHAGKMTLVLGAGMNAAGRIDLLHGQSGRFLDVLLVEGAADQGSGGPAAQYGSIACPAIR